MILATRLNFWSSNHVFLSLNFRNRRDNSIFIVLTISCDKITELFTNCQVVFLFGWWVLSQDLPTTKWKKAWMEKKRINKEDRERERWDEWWGEVTAEEWQRQRQSADILKERGPGGRNLRESGLPQFLQSSSLSSSSIINGRL